MSVDEAQDSGPVVVVSSSFGESRPSVVDICPDTRKNPFDPYAGFAASEACTLPSELEPSPHPPESSEIAIVRVSDRSRSVDGLRDELEGLRELLVELGAQGARLEAVGERQRERIEQLERLTRQRATQENRAILAVAAALALLAITTFVAFGPLR